MLRLYRQLGSPVKPAGEHATAGEGHHVDCARPASKLGRREIGHVHRNGVADFAFPKSVREELMAAGRAAPHQAGVPGGVSYDVRTPDDVPRVVALFRLSYDRARAAADRAAGGPEGDPPRAAGR